MMNAAALEGVLPRRINYRESGTGNLPSEAPMRTCRLISEDRLEK